MFGSEMEPLGQTWIEISGEACGARADERGPIGGGEGYTNVVSPAAEAVSTLDELLEALAQARPGDVVYVGWRGGNRLHRTGVCRISRAGDSGGGHPGR